MTVWRKTRGWLYETFDRDVDPAELAGCSDIARMWREKSGDRPAPAWADYQFREFAGWHDRISLADVSYNPFNLRYRLVGTKLSARLGKDYTGMSYSELVASGLDPVDDFEFYEMICSKMLISRVSGDLRWAGTTPVSVTFVEFPLCDGGDRATHILGVML